MLREQGTNSCQHLCNGVVHDGKTQGLNIRALDPSQRGIKVLGFPIGNDKFVSRQQRLDGIPNVLVDSDRPATFPRVVVPPSSSSWLLLDSACAVLGTTRGFALERAVAQVVVEPHECHVRN